LLGRFVQPDSIIPDPGNPQSLDRYAYSFNNPIKHNDPSGHWPSTPSFLCPLSYDTISLTFKGFAKAFAGLDVDVNISIDTRPIRQGYESGGVGGAVEGIFNTELGLSATDNISAGASAEVLIGVGITGSDGGVSDQNGIKLWGRDGYPINYAMVLPPVGEPSIAVFGGTTLNNNGDPTSQTWGIAYGPGLIDLSTDLISATDWAIYGSGKDIKLQWPFFNKNFWDEFKKNLDEITE
jgi:hypothetical protein